MKATTLRGFIYMALGFLSPWLEKVVPLLWEGTWPTPQACVACVIVGTGTAMLAYRAYIDGSFEREKQNGNTQLISKP